MILCADDYGISPSVSRGIVELVDRGRVSATSCMVTGSANLEQQMSEIAARREIVDVGLHLTLTDNMPLTDGLTVKSGLVEATGRFLRFGQLLTNCYLKRIDPELLRQEVMAQLTYFFELVGAWPTHIDGHQHVQQLPMIREALVEVCRQTLDSKFYVRSGCFAPRWLFNQDLYSDMRNGSFLIASQSIGLVRLLRDHGVAHNRYLLGYYSYEGRHAFGEVLSRYARLGPDGDDILFTHPGYVDEELKRKDGVTGERLNNLEYLMGPSLGEELERHGLTINRFRSWQALG